MGTANGKTGPHGMSRLRRRRRKAPAIIAGLCALALAALFVTGGGPARADDGSTAPFSDVRIVSAGGGTTGSQSSCEQANGKTVCACLGEHCWLFAKMCKVAGGHVSTDGGTSTECYLDN
jgi:hypothetical protein